MGYSFVAAVYTMNMRLVVPRTGMAGCTLLRIDRTHFDLVVVYLASMRMMQVAIVKIIRVTIMLHCDMPTVRAMSMAVRAGVFLVVSWHVHSFHKKPMSAAASI